VENPVQLGEEHVPAGLALVFDMDGVLIDSSTTHRQAWLAFNRRYGIETTPEMHRRTFGLRNDQIVRQFYGNDLPEDEVAARGAAKEMLYREMVGEGIEALLLPGIRRFLEQYQRTPMAVATNAEPPNVNFLLDRAGLRRFFQAVVTGAQVTHPKPDPEVYLRAARALKTAPADCIVFEDSAAGIAAARAAGTRVIGISTTYGYLPGTDITIDNFESRRLREWLAAQTRVS
jgi:beta-phosphoglucomutase family hydrolase